MTKPAHTPGPWHVLKMKGWGLGLSIGRRPQNEADETAGDAPIAMVLDGAHHWDEKYPMKANARLIAAAPEMAEALSIALEYDREIYDDRDWDIMSAALTKALGPSTEDKET